MSGERKQVGTKLDAALYRQVRALAFLQGRKAGEVIDDAVRAYLATQSSTRRQRLRRTKFPSKANPTA